MTVDQQPGVGHRADRLAPGSAGSRSGSMLARRLLTCSPTGSPGPPAGRSSQGARIVSEVHDVGVRHPPCARRPTAGAISRPRPGQGHHLVGRRDQHVELSHRAARRSAWCGLRRSCTVKTNGFPATTQHPHQPAQLVGRRRRRSRSAGGTRRIPAVARPLRAAASPAATTAPGGAVAARRGRGRAAARPRRPPAATGAGRTRDPTAPTRSGARPAAGPGVPPQGLPRDAHARCRTPWDRTMPRLHP